MNKDLTVGSPSRLLWKFCLPLFASVIFQQLYNVADSLVAGNFIGENALAAVGNSYEITLVYLAFAVGCNIGCSVIVAQLFGAKRYRDMKTAVSTAMIVTGVTCLLLVLVGVLFGREMLALIKTPDEIMEDSLTYLEIYTFGLPFLFFYNVSTGIFSALGDSRTPFIFLACSSTVNIGMDILFVAAFGMGVSGVAWATFICQGVSCVLALFVVVKRLISVKTEGRPRIFSRSLFVSFIRIAVPSTLQQSFVSVGNIIIQYVINGFGPAFIAGYSAAIKLNNLVISSLVTIGNGISNYGAQNIGAGKHERILPGFFAGVRMVFVLAIPLTVLYLVFASPLIGFFIKDATEQALDTGTTFLRILAPFYALIAVKFVSDGFLRGAGDMIGFMTGTFTDLILRVALAFLFSFIAAPTTLFWAWPIGWCVAVAVSVAFFRFGKWRHPHELTAKEKQYR